MLINPEISVIIPFAGAVNELIKCLDGLKEQRIDLTFEVIVVESGNCENRDELIKSYSNLTLIGSSTLLFPSRARNIGVRNSKANFLAFTDADCVPSSNWLSEIYTSLSKGNKIIIGPITNLYPFHPIASVDNLLQFPDFQMHRHSDNFSHFPACNLGITKELYFETGGFPEDVVTGEDVKFSELAIKKNKGKLYYNHRSIVKHSGRKYFNPFIKHNYSLGFHRGYLNLKISSIQSKYRDTLLYAFLFGAKRLIYITVRTIQWNPISLFRLIFYFPLLIIGLSAWVKGFWKGNQKYLENLK